MRKMHPIYSALDNGNFEQAVRLCQKKDVEKWDLTKALKASALARLGHRDAAMELCREVNARAPADENVISALAHTYRSLDAFDDVANLYEAASRAQPSNPDFLQNVFVAAIRAQNYQKAQQVALKLFKLEGPGLGTRYKLWAATCMYLQVKEGGTAPAILTLAERMVETALGEANHVGTGEELRFYVLMLVEQGKVKEALAALQKFGGQGSTDTVNVAIVDEHSVERGSVMAMEVEERKELEARLLTELGDVSAAKSVYVELLEEHADQWSYYMKYLELVVGTASKSEGENSVQLVAAALCEAQTLVLRLREAHPQWRGPQLAELELLQRAVNSLGPHSTLPSEWQSTTSSTHSLEEFSGTSLGSLCTAIASYFDAFCTKSCCFEDLRPYLTSLVRLGKGGAEEGKVIFNWLFVWLHNVAVQEACADSVPKPATEVLPKEEREAALSRLRRYICASQLLRFLGARGPPAEEVEDSEEILAVVRTLVHQYRATLHINAGTEGGQREVQVGDELVLLAAHALRDYYRTKDGAVAYLLRFECITLLEFASECSPYNYHFRLMATEIYKELGSFSQGIHHYQILDTKQIQVDSLSYLLFPGCMRCGYFMEASKRCRGVLSLHRNCARDTRDFTGKALLCGNYTKALEISAFQKERMDHSLQLALSRVELMFLELLLIHHTLPDAEQFAKEQLPAPPRSSVDGSERTKEEIDALSDNMDYFVTLSWDAPSEAPHHKTPADTTGINTTPEPPPTVAHGRLNGIRHRARLHRQQLMVGVIRRALIGDPDLLVTVAALRDALMEREADKVSTLAADISAISLQEKSNDGRQKSVFRCSNQLMLACAQALGQLNIALGGAAKARTAVAAIRDGGSVADLSMFPGALESMNEAEQLAHRILEEITEASWTRICNTSDTEGRETLIPMTAEWLSSLSYAVWCIGTLISPLLQCLAAILAVEEPTAAAKKKEKGAGKKGKKKKTASSSSQNAGEHASNGGPPNTSEDIKSIDLVRIDEGTHALQSLGGTVLKVLSFVSESMRREESGKEVENIAQNVMVKLVKGGLGVNYSCVLPFLFESGALGDRVGTGVLRGQGEAAQRLHGIAKVKIAALQQSFHISSTR